MVLIAASLKVEDPAQDLAGRGSLLEALVAQGSGTVLWRSGERVVLEAKEKTPFGDIEFEGKPVLLLLVPRQMLDHGTPHCSKAVCGQRKLAMAQQGTPCFGQPVMFEDRSFQRIGIGSLELRGNLAKPF